MWGEGRSSSGKRDSVHTEHRGQGEGGRDHPLAPSPRPSILLRRPDGRLASGRRRDRRGVPRMRTRCRFLEDAGALLLRPPFTHGLFAGGQCRRQRCFFLRRWTISEAEARGGGGPRQTYRGLVERPQRVLARLPGAQGLPSSSVLFPLFGVVFGRLVGQRLSQSGKIFKDGLLVCITCEVFMAVFS